MTDLSSSLLSLGIRRAVDEARLWLGATSPNPAVGAAALDQSGNIIAVGAHHRAGEDHAEAGLLKFCCEQNLLPRVHTLCVTLEPCNHYGRKPPCTEAIIASGVRRVAVGTSDPNPHVIGGGCERLRQAGITVIENIESEMCRRLLHPFAFHTLTGKPFVTVKRAFDAQGSMIPPEGQTVFTSKESLILAHRLRKKADAIVTGSGTILADNPQFTVRHMEDHPNKRRILAILDRREQVSQDYTAESARRGLDAIFYQDIDSCFVDLEKRGVRDALVEAGPTLSQSVLGSSYWGMCVDIYKGEPDRVEMGFNPKIQIPFDTKDVSLESLLPL